MNANGQERPGAPADHAAGRSLTKDELNQVLESHRACRESGGARGAVADLSDASLPRARLSRLDLQGSTLTGANLTEAELQGTNLRKADLQGTNLVRADLSGAALDRAVLRGADLSEAKLRRADLSRADLRDAELTGANMTGADLVRADLRGASLSRASLREANLQDADCTGTTGLLPGQLGGANLAGARLPVDLKFEGLANVADSSKGTQNLFTSILLVCAYTWLTVASTTDAQLLDNAALASSKLPILGVDIPLPRFYLVIPFLLLCLFLYFHLGLQRLWEELAELPAIFPDGRPLDKKAYPWLLNVLVRAHVTRLRANRSHLSRWQGRISVMLAWGLVPATLLLVWARYLRGHEWVVTSLHAISLAVSIGAGAGFLRLAASTLRGSERREFLWNRAWRDARLLSALVGGVSLALLFVISFGAIEGTNPFLRGIDVSPPPLVRYPDPRIWVPYAFRGVGYVPFANLDDITLSVKPANWSTAPMDVESKPLAKANGQGGPSPPRAVPRQGDLALVKGANLESRNLRYATAYGVFLVNGFLRWIDASHSDLRAADLRGADLRDSNLTGANLRDADLSQADLKRSRLVNTRFKDAVMPKAKFSGANMESAFLEGAVLEDSQFQAMDDTPAADLRRAVLRGANLIRADLTGADLREADLRGAFLGSAHLDKADLRGTDIRGADLSTVIGLTSEQLEVAVTDETTRLPAAFSETFLPPR